MYEKTDIENLITKAFARLNNFKRARAKAEQAKDYDRELEHLKYKLIQYKEFDQLELLLRAIQQEARKNNPNYIESRNRITEDK